jgi:hypothetical protein
MKDRSTDQAPRQRPSARVTHPPGTALSSVVLAPHQAIREMVSAARQAPAISGEPRRLFQLYDTCLATLSRHLAAVQEVLYPAVRRHLLPEGKAWVADQVHLARHIERVMRVIEGSLYGEVHEVGLSHQQMWDGLVRLLDDHDRAEEEAVAVLGQRLTPDQQESFAAAFAGAVRCAPTRPHPYSPHSHALGRLSHRMWSLADRAMDEMDGRVIPHEPPKPPSPKTLWGQYLLGQPMFEETEGER